VLAIAALSTGVGLPAQKAKNIGALPAQTAERGPVIADIDDSDLFFQNTIRASGPQRDNSQKIEALLKRMTLEEKVGQMTQLAIGMIATGQDQTVRSVPARLIKAFGIKASGQILTFKKQALLVDRCQEI